MRPPASAALFALAAIAVVAVRAVLLPTPGLVADIDMFAVWAHWLTSHPLGEAFNDLQLSYGPVVTYLLGLLAWVQPSFATATDAVDLGVRLTLKLPAVLADLGLAAGAWWHLRDRYPARPLLALAAGLAVGLNPAILYVSAWWGQYDSLYVLPALVGFLLVVRGRSSWAAVALAVAVLTKPQALPLLVPFAAFVLARDGWRGWPRPTAAALLAAALLWLPFVPAGGPAAYLRDVAAFQDSLFGVLSLRAWNPWWILQLVATGGDFAQDGTAIVGPVTFRLVGLVAAAVLELLVFRAVWRRPTAAGLAWGMAAASLVAFVTLTTMHERYSYPALVFLVLAFPDRRAVGVWAVLTAAVTLNLVAAIPFSAEAGALLPVGGLLGIAGSLVVTACAAACLVALRQLPPGDGSPGDGSPRADVGAAATLDAP